MAFTNLDHKSIFLIGALEISKGQKYVLEFQRIYKLWRDKRINTYERVEKIIKKQVVK